MNISQLEGWFGSAVFDGEFLARVGIAVVLVAVWWALLARASARQRRERMALTAEVDNLRRENKSVVELAVRASKRLREAEQELRQMSVRLDGMSHPAPAVEGGHAYDQAIRLVRRGADADRLVNDLGMTRGEADLVVRLHGPRKTG